MKIDDLPKSIQRDINVLRRLYQATCICQNKMDEYELLDCLNFYWWQDKLETTEPQCWEYDGCGACFQWTQIEEEKKRGEKLLEELVKLREGVKIAKSNIPNHLSHLTDKITSLCIRFNICSNLKYL